jgi:hypothetical protein
MAFPPTSSERARDLAQRMLKLIADDRAASYSDCGTAALYVMAACIAMMDRHAEIVGNVGGSLPVLVKANREELERLTAAKQ